MFKTIGEIEETVDELGGWGDKRGANAVQKNFKLWAPHLLKISPATTLCVDFFTVGEI